MASGGSTPSPLPKVAITISQQPQHSSQPQSCTPPSTTDRQKRNGNVGPVASRQIASPRNNQNLRRQQKMRRPHLEDEDGIAEASAVRSAGSRRGQRSITHLMNFSLPPRPPLRVSDPLHHHPHGQVSLRWPMDRARYIHANYRFVLNPKTQYRLENVDERIDWGDVWQVLASRQHQAASCPICLSAPVASRMVKCGHMFCFACLIRYLHSSSERQSVNDRKSRWGSCPICWDVIYLPDARPVRWLQVPAETPQEGADVVLRLMTRKPGHILALPRDSADFLQDDLPWCFAAEVLDYAKVMKGTEDYMLSHFDKECEEIALQAEEDELRYGEDSTWTQKAIAAIQNSKDLIRVKDETAATGSRDHRRNIPIRIVKSGDDFNTTPDDLHTFGYHEGIDPAVHSVLGSGPPPNPRHKLGYTEPHVQSNETTSKLAWSSRRSSKARGRGPSAPLNALFYFYQSLPHYYLAPLDVRILKAAFNDYFSFPTTILPRVDGVSRGHVVDEDMRRRVKYLAHLPRGCEVNFLECDFNDIVPAHILDRFAEDIERRRKRNQEKQLREEKDRIKSERDEEEKRWAAIRRKRSGLPHDELDEANVSSFEFKSLSDGVLAQDSREDETSSPHQRLEQDTSPFDALASPSTSPSTQKTVWGTPAIAPIILTGAASKDPEEERQDDDGWLHGWEDHLTDGAVPGSAPSEPLDFADGFHATSRTSSGGPRKKGKKITLLTTTARRAA